MGKKTAATSKSTATSKGTTISKGITARSTASSKGSTTSKSKGVGKSKSDGAKKTATKTSSARSETKPWATGDAMLAAGLDVAHKADIRSLVLYVDGLQNYDLLDRLDFSNDKLSIILITRSEEAYEQARRYTRQVVRLPEVSLTRTGQIKMAVMLSFSKRQLQPGDRFVFLTGLMQGKLDTMMVMQVGAEYEMFQTVDQPPLTEHIRRAVFERTLNLALQLAAEGREGKPIGAIFVLGDANEVAANSRQLIMNPFKGHDESRCNILNDDMTETIKEFAAIDGAFVIKGNGTIVSAGTYLLPKVLSEELPQGLGARHMAAAAITAATKSVAITISESTGTVRIWRQGQLITEIEKAKRTHTSLTEGGGDGIK